MEVPTFREFAKRYLNEDTAHLAPTTRKDRDSYLRKDGPLVGFFGEQRLDAIGVPELRAHAVAYLVLYNLMFVVPLVIVFLLSYYGTTSDQLAQFFRSHAASVKLCTAVFFFALAGLLVSVLV